MGPEVLGGTGQLDPEESLGKPGQLHPQKGSVGRGRAFLGGTPCYMVLWVETPGRQVLEVPSIHFVHGQSWPEPWQEWPRGNGGASRTLSGRLQGNCCKVDRYVWE